MAAVGRAVRPRWGDARDRVVYRMRNRATGAEPSVPTSVQK
jgi:hypothetical protein